MRKLMIAFVGFLLMAAIAWIFVAWQINQPPKPIVLPSDETNDLGMAFVRISPGSFMMGSPADEVGRRPDETPHNVRLTTGYFMSVTPVTWGQWEALMPKPEMLRLPKRHPDWPVDFISWDDCQEFIQKLRARHGKPYRLPTEAEWEYACRAGTKSAFAFGNMLTAKEANFGKFQRGSTPLSTTKVGMFPANRWGLTDMHGHLWEWCQDWYGEYPAGDAVDPQGPVAGQDRVVRGGSFNDLAIHCRSAMRHHSIPSGRDETIGFRLVYSAE